MSTQENLYSACLNQMQDLNQSACLQILARIGGTVKTYFKRPLKNRQNKDLNDKW